MTIAYDPILVKILEDARETILRKIERDADLHYSNFIFSAEYPDQTPEEKWMGSYGRDDADLLSRINGVLHTLYNLEG